MNNQTYQDILDLLLKPVAEERRPFRVAHQTETISSQGFVRMAPSELVFVDDLPLDLGFSPHQYAHLLKLLKEKHSPGPILPPAIERSIHAHHPTTMWEPRRQRPSGQIFIPCLQHTITRVQHTFTKARRGGHTLWNVTVQVRVDILDVPLGDMVIAGGGL